MAWLALAVSRSWLPKQTRAASLLDESMPLCFPLALLSAVVCVSAITTLPCASDALLLSQPLCIFRFPLVLMPTVWSSLHLFLPSHALLFFCTGSHYQGHC